MKTSELRIGNIIEYHGKIITVAGIVRSTIYYESKELCFDGNIGDYKPFKPIPLTEEWLLKFGFKPTNDHFYAIKTGITWVTLEVCLDSRVILFNRKKTAFIDLKYTKYVHQLQNLFFALTGEELTIKEETK